MADLKKARASFLELVEDLDPDVKVTFPAKATQGNYLIELTRGDAEVKQVVKVSEKDLLKLEDDEDLRQVIEERVLAAIDKLPDDGEEGDIEDEDLDEEDADDEELEEELEDDDFEEEEEKEGEEETEP
jgi:uncharacterized membrane-anchored protein YjiN (DUF445 family)